MKVRDMYAFDGKVALVTGAAGGMGRATAVRFARAGASVVVSDLSGSAGDETVELMERKGGTGVFLPADITKSQQVEGLVTETVSRYGRLDFACNAAAIDIERGTPLDECPDDLFEKIIATNLAGTFYCMKHQIRQMKKQESGGAIVNIGSVSAFRTRAGGNAAYVASKAGLLGLTRNGAQGYARQKIRINTVCPGAIDTPMLASSLKAIGVTHDELGAIYGTMGRIGKPDEIAEAVLWLCSDMSSFTVGAVLTVDGGALIS